MVPACTRFLLAEPLLPPVRPIPIVIGDALGSLWPLPTSAKASGAVLLLLEPWVSFALIGFPTAPLLLQCKKCAVASNLNPQLGHDWRLLLR